MGILSMDTNIVSFLAAHARAVPEKHAFTILSNEGDAPQEITYRELQARVQQIAFYLGEKQLNTRTVLLVYQDMLAFIISFLACQYTGVIAVPVPYARGSKHVQRINGIIADAATDTILCTAATVDSLRDELNPAAGTLQFITTDGLPVDQQPLAIAPRYNDISFIQYTSGSVGIPKGVVVTSKSLLHNEKLIQQTFGCVQQSVILSWLPFHHDMGLIGNVLHTIYVGCSCVLMSPLHFIQKPKAWLTSITTYKVTHSGAPNFAYDLCVDRIPIDELTSIDLSTWKVAFNGSEPVHAATLQRFTKRFESAGFNAAAFMPCYGLAEATLLVSGTKTTPLPLTIYIDKDAAEAGRIQLCEQHDGAKAVVSSGLPAEGMLVKIVSLHNQQECDNLEEGEICIAGESVTSGYWNRDNHELFYDFDGTKFLRTGDLGFLYEGALFVHGRVKEMLIVRGKNHYPYDIEQEVFVSHDAIESNGVAVFSVDDDAAIVVVAEIKRAYAHHVDSEAIIAGIDKILNGLFGIDPYDIVLTTPLGIPRTTSGKLQRIKCRAYYHNKAFNVIASKEGMTARPLKKERDPHLLSALKQTPTYANIRTYLIDIIITKNAAELPDTLSDDTDMTALGVDSLRSMEIINTVNQELHIHLDPAKLYQHNTLAAICNAIDALLWLKTETTQTFGNEITI